MRERGCSHNCRLEGTDEKSASLSSLSFAELYYLLGSFDLISVYLLQTPWSMQVSRPRLWGRPTPRLCLQDPLTPITARPCLSRGRRPGFKLQSKEHRLRTSKSTVLQSWDPTNPWPYSRFRNLNPTNPTLEISTLESSIPSGNSI